MGKLPLLCCASLAVTASGLVLQAQTCEYAEVPVLVVVYTNYYKDSDTFMHLTADDVEALKDVLPRSVEFFWRSSNLRCHVTLEYLVVDRTLTPEQMWFAWGEGGCWMPWWSMDGETSVRQDVLDAGYQPADVASVVAMYAFANDEEVWAAIGGGAYGMNCGVLGPAGYVGIPLCWGIESMEGYFTHEFLHELDSIFYCSGNPDDMFHADHAHAFPYPDDCGQHFNFLISNTLDPDSWLDLGAAWTTVRGAPDADGDGVPDSGQLPITEASLGTSTSLIDSDDDGLSDFAEILATYHSMSDPLAQDSDGDSILDADDPYPLYVLSSEKVRCGTPVIDGVVAADEYTELACLDGWEPDIDASLYALWTQQALYVAVDVVDDVVITDFVEVQWCDHIELFIDADRDDWFLDVDPGNYRFMVSAQGHDGHVLGDDYYYDPDHDPWHPFSTNSVTSKYTLSDQGYVLELGIPLALMPALQVQPGGLLRLTLEVIDIDEWEWPRYNIYSGLAGGLPGFVELTLAPPGPGDLNGDGCVDQADLGILLADWGCDTGDCAGDCDADGDTDQADLGILLASWGEGCP